MPITFSRERKVLPMMLRKPNAYVMLTKCIRMKLDLFIIPVMKINLKLTIDLNVRPWTIKFLEKNTEEELFSFGLDNDFFIVASKVQATKAK